MSNEALLTQLDSGVLTVTINRPEVRNAFDTATQRHMTEVFYDAARNPSVRVLVLTGTGKAFSTGGDVKTLGGRILAILSHKSIRRIQYGPPLKREPTGCAR